MRIRTPSTCIYIYIYTRMSMRNFVYSKDLEGSCRHVRWRIVGVMFLPSIFENRCGDFRRSTIDVTMCRSSKIDVSTFGDRFVDLRRSMIDVSTFEDR